MRKLTTYLLENAQKKAERQNIRQKYRVQEKTNK